MYGELFAKTFATKLFTTKLKYSIYLGSNPCIIQSGT